ncbi:hypothetical protein [Brevibacillus sp. SYSU BS000544]|uniref:hypothetical protein n=1 Tax=Brevibacillus sp. SYSU BS000544 TaxID=3416443 RepID=UPI003CE5BF92
MSKKRLVFIFISIGLVLLLCLGYYSYRLVPYTYIPYDESLFKIISVKSKDGVNVFTIDTHARGRVYQIAFHNWRLPQNISVVSKSGVIHVFFEEQQNSQQTRDTIISFEAESDPRAIKFYQNGKLVGSQNFFYAVE